MAQNAAALDARPIKEDLDPNIAQARASDPASSAWVNASAGTGKTKVLTDRVLRLLLPRADGQAGTKPHKILCLTFTKAGAGEMALRLNEKLGAWAVMPQEELGKTLSKLLGRAAKAEDIDAARRLFAEVVDTPGGLKIMTIHSFCQSVLSRFPLEAGMSPHCTVIEESQAQQFLAQAQRAVFQHIEQEAGSPLHSAFYSLAQTVNEEQFFDLIQDIVRERHQMAALSPWAVEGFYTSLCQDLGILPHRTRKEIIEAACQDAVFDRSGLLGAVEILTRGTEKSDQPKAQQIQTWLEKPIEERVQHFDAYKLAFLTVGGAIRKTLATKSACAAIDVLEAEATRIQEVEDHAAKAQSAAFTRDLLCVGAAVLERYQNIKTQQAVLDYDDLIHKTLYLLRDKDGRLSMNAWVHYKLDEGLDHILVDESQDTNPEQWQIIAALCDDFFSGQAARDDTERTVFSVGDEKQSIFSFQRAAPEEFANMKSYFATKIKEAQQSFSAVPLNISFRSSQPILDVVDCIFSAPAGAEHHSFRRGQEGLVELWPVFESEKAEKRDPWAPPVDIVSAQSGAAKLAEHIGATIKTWLDQGEILPARGRSVQPGDIMILVRTRNAFTNQILRALKTRKIPVSGIDRMVLSDELVVEDLFALANFALLPRDDLTLACVLKSPLLGWDEDQLYDLAVERKATLWGALPDGAVKNYLQQLIALARYAHPFEFFSYILQTPCPGDEISGLRSIKGRLGDDVLDPLDEFLEASLKFEKDHIPSLQQFVHHQTRERIAIKRELEEAGGHVRIMTVHGSKGLQAPIVILPDTTGTSRSAPNQAAKRLLWPDKSGLAYPLWSPRKDTEFDLYRRGKEKLQQNLDAEYQRLLYVAMTRAEDRLYIGGSLKASKMVEGCWYESVKTALQAMEGVQAQGDALQFSKPQTRPPDRLSAALTEKKDVRAEPDWLFQPAPQEPDPPAPLVPSRLSMPEPASVSPLSSGQNYRFRRGNLTHILLQFLPDQPAEKRAWAATEYITRQAQDLPEEIRVEIIQEVLAILENPDFAGFFAPGSKAEVPITGLMPDGRLLSGQIDRLVVTADSVWILDYKSNRPPPGDAKDVAVTYKNQLQAYRDAIAQIYPDRVIHTALLWTDGPQLMILDLSSTD